MFLFTPAFLVAWLLVSKWLALPLLIFGMLTEAIDGRCARQEKRDDEGFGAWLDPVADKCLQVSAFWTVWLALVPLEVVIVRTGLEMALMLMALVIAALYEQNKNQPSANEAAVKNRMRSNIIGKAKTIADSVILPGMILAVLFNFSEWSAFPASAVFTIALALGSLILHWRGYQWLKRYFKEKEVVL